MEQRHVSLLKRACVFALVRVTDDSAVSTTLSRTYIETLHYDTRAYVCISECVLGGRVTPL